MGQNWDMQVDDDGEYVLDHDGSRRFVSTAPRVTATLRDDSGTECTIEGGYVTSPRISVGPAGIITTPNRLSAEKKAELRRQWKEMFGKALERGWITADEARAEFGLPPTGTIRVYDREPFGWEVSPVLRILLGTMAAMVVCGGAVKLILAWMGGV